MPRSAAIDTTKIAIGRSVDPDEVARFAALAATWWDPRGPMAPLHRLNPTRIAFIRDHAAARFGRDALGDRPLRDLDLLDVGCGCGLLAEPMSRLGATVTGIDAAEENLQVAVHHAAEAGLTIDYQHAAAEEIAAAGKQFDIVLNMEIVEHVADLDTFLGATCALTKPGGVIFVATLNRTPQSFVLGIIAAERILRWLPPGTHQWRKFVRPAELARPLRRGGVALGEITGVRYNPIAGSWSLGNDLSVNYMAVGVKEGG
jgi:2-polyprenyl-6-hydroxyphenyl methylase/3-demethylubiquinone-9 3-methyltransferase